MRDLVLVLGDQLSHDSPALREIDPRLDLVLFLEAEGEARRVPSHKARIALFLSAMRHHAAALRARGLRVVERRLGEQGPEDLGEAFTEALGKYAPRRVVFVEPGEWDLAQDLERRARDAQVPCLVLDDDHFLVSRAEFASWAKGRATLRMETFYHHVRATRDLLMRDGQPEGGRWNFDAENRKGFGAKGPGWVPRPVAFAPDAITREVIDLVRERFPDHPGSLDSFDWPVTREQALDALDDFASHRLERFGETQDALWSTEPVLFHARLSAAMNLKLLSPREVLDRVLAEGRARSVPLSGLEGFVRQVAGWREFVRGVYWLDMPGLREANHFRHGRDLPTWYWTGRTRMRCLALVVGQVLETGYAHHIQRLMVLGLFGLTAGIAPRQVSDWFLALFVDAVEWVELPNVAGMALYANGGRFTSKPYAAGGAYIDRMGDSCEGCRYRPDRRTGPQACPLTVFYWDFLARHAKEFSRNPRMAPALSSWNRFPAAEREAIAARARELLEDLEAL